VLINFVVRVNQPVLNSKYAYWRLIGYQLAGLC